MTLWATVFGAICVQATPFVVLGVLLSTVLAATPVGWLPGLLPRRPAFAVPVCGLAGTALPGCACGSVPAAAALMSRGVPAGPATAFMICAPSANPVVLAATAAAYPGEPMVVGARFAAALLLASCVGWLTSVDRLGRPRPAEPDRPHHAHGHSLTGLVGLAADDALRSLGLLAAGAAAAATLVVWLPRGLLAGLADRPLLSVVALAMLATLLSVCSQADAFIARTFVGFSRTAQLAFMVVGPAVDVKLAAMQTATFGARFTGRFVLLTFVVAIAAAVVAAGVLL